MAMRNRWLMERLIRMLRIFPVVLIQGARQVGKTTLARQLIERGVLEHYYSFDDYTTLAAARSDPVSFVHNLPPRSVLDEVQRVPEVLLAIKARVDTQREPGLLVLTGSSHPLWRLCIGEPLVGRMGVVTLYPLSQGEFVGKRERWLDQTLQGHCSSVVQSEGGLWERVVIGGFPPARLATTAQQARDWLKAYIDLLLTREVRALADIERVSDLPLILRMLAISSAQLLNLTNLSRECGIPQTTLRRYLSLFEAIFLVSRVPAWYANIGQRFLKTPKVLLHDTGIACALLDIDPNRVQADPLLKGRLLETFVGAEILKQIEFTGHSVQLYHLRRANGQEVDFVLETASGHLVGVEVKASASIDARAFDGLKRLQQVVGDRWLAGVVLYTGDQTVPFGERLWAQPVSALWETGQTPESHTD